MKNLNDIILPITAELQQFKVYFKQSLKADTEPMNTIMQYVLETNGKRLRPLLVLLSAKLFGEVNGKTFRAATFAEMIHNATLIHDDVVDDSDLRRGQASVKAQFGNLSAVLAGDFLLSKAMQLLASPSDFDILNEMLRTTVAMSEGELMQNTIGLSYNGSCFGNCNMNGCHDARVLQPQYLNIITRKTAMLMRSCCASGAMSVEATTEQVQKISNFGLNFGILFQLRDDILDDENTAEAQALLSEYLQKTVDSLKIFPASETLEALRDLTVFCAEREA